MVVSVPINLCLVETQTCHLYSQQNHLVYDLSPQAKLLQSTWMHCMQHEKPS